MMTFNELSSLWFKEKRVILKGTKIQRIEKVLNKYINPLLGSFDLDALSDSVFQEYYAQLYFQQTFKSRRTGSFTNYYKDILDDICEYAATNGINTTLRAPNPSRIQNTAELSFNKPDAKKIDAMLEEERGTAISIIVRLAWHAGLIRKEIAQLKWENINFEKRMLWVQDREIPLHDALYSSLLEYSDNNNSDYVIATKQGTSYAEYSIANLVAYTLDYYGMGNIRLMDFRHDYVIDVLNKARVGDLPDLARQLGYKNCVVLLRKYKDYILRKRVQG